VGESHLPIVRDMWCGVLYECVAVRCSVLHCAAVCCSVLQCAAVRCSALQYIAARSGMLHVTNSACRLSLSVFSYHLHQHACVTMSLPPCYLPTHPTHVSSCACVRTLSLSVFHSVSLSPESERHAVLVTCNTLQHTATYITTHYSITFAHFTITCTCLIRRG